jgi:hypothetical protein
MTNHSDISNIDIKFTNEDICILFPECKKGIVIYSNYICTNLDEGLKTGKRLHQEGIEFGRSIYHPYIFFRAPYYSHDINYTTIESEINSSFGEKQNEIKSRVYIRVDPNRTYVFSSEIRAKSNSSYTLKFPRTESSKNTQIVLNRSRKTLTEYLEIIKQNSILIKNKSNDENIWYNLYTSRVVFFPSSIKKTIDMYDKSPINRNSEILVAIPCLTRDYFVYWKES